MWLLHRIFMYIFCWKKVFLSMQIGNLSWTPSQKFSVNFSKFFKTVCCRTHVNKCLFTGPMCVLNRFLLLSLNQTYSSRVKRLCVLCKQHLLDSGIRTLIFSKCQIKFRQSFTWLYFRKEFACTQIKVVQVKLLSCKIIDSGIFSHAASATCFSFIRP